MKIAGVQFACSDDKEKNTEKACKMMDMATGEGAKIVCFQELFNLYWFPRSRDKGAFALAEKITGPTVSRMREKAAGAGSVVVLPFFEKEGKTFYNSCAVIDADGEVAGVYRKIHVPDIPLWEEKFYFSTGNLGFPVFRRATAASASRYRGTISSRSAPGSSSLKGADIIFAPTACSFKSQHIWQTVITSNAITNACFVMRVNRVGSEESHDFYGMSFSASPEGEMISGPTGRADGIMLADVDQVRLAEIRREWPIIRERRPALYTEICKE